MSVPIINPATGGLLKRKGEWLIDDQGQRVPIVQGIPRFCESDNYARNFATQWNIFRETQLDVADAYEGPSERRFFSETEWKPADLSGADILEVGSGAGRFSQVVLKRTSANLYSIDYSAAVDVNLNNNRDIAPERFHIFQASIYDMPFPDSSFDKVFCFGVLQHTPDFEASVRSLIRKAKPGSEIVVDFYCIRGFWTKISGKYLLRPVTRRMSHERLLRLIRAKAPFMLRIAQAMNRLGLHLLTRILPIPDLRTMPPGLTGEELREWIVLDTFDMLSPEHDNPQRIGTVARWFERHGADVTFAGEIYNGSGRAAVIRARKRLTSNAA